MTDPTDIPDRFDRWRRRLEDRLEQTLPAAAEEPTRLHQAMRYATLSGGKRIRPLLVYAAGHALGVDCGWSDPVACAVELIHAYSLIHDDLPAMDDDALRRGRPTCHLAFDEATAILAGDALQALAFDTLAAQERIPAKTRIALVGELTAACGSTGMAGGQMLDLDAAGRILELDELERIHRLKTGALIQASVTSAALLADADDAVRARLERFGRSVGLGFQIRDDLLDVTGEVERTGKQGQTDAARSQPTFPALIGVDGSVARADQLRREALECLEGIAGDTLPLAWLADYMIRRDR